MRCRDRYRAEVEEARFHLNPFNPFDSHPKCRLVTSVGILEWEGRKTESNGTHSIVAREGNFVFHAWRSITKGWTECLTLNADSGGRTWRQVRLASCPDLLIDQNEAETQIGHWRNQEKRAVLKGSSCSSRNRMREERDGINLIKLLLFFIFRTFFWSGSPPSICKSPSLSLSALFSPPPPFLVLPLTHICQLWPKGVKEEENNS